MAGGTCTDKRGISDNLRERKEWSHHNYCHREFSSKLVNNNQPSDYFNGRKISEFKRTYTKNISLLQKNILRIFTGCHHSDLYIIHGTNVLQTNCCIFKTRSPTLYNVLEKFFANGVKPIKCYLNTAQVFHRIESFVRLLYINFDISKEEQALLAILLSKKSSIELEARNSENDLSSSSSEMADSGLETGSLSINETTESENSGTDIEESHVTDYISTDDDFMRVSSSCDGEKLNGKKKIKEGEKEKNCWSEGRDTISSDGNACGSSFSMARQLNEKYKTRNNGVEEEEEDETTIDDVSRYENEVLNDIFYESDGGNDNEQSGSFIQTGSFEFIEPESLPSTTTPIQTTATSSKKIKTPSVEVFDQFPSLLDEKVATNSSTKSLIVESTHHELSHSNDNSLNKSSSSVNNYYFIDASSLNDETEIITTTGASLPIYLDSVSYIPSRSNNLNDQLNKPNSHSSSGHEKIAEFQRELKLTETLEPVTEQRKVKRVDSLTDDKSNEKQIEKESLVVEIKEVDSGESNHPSPCIDNNKPASKFENDMSIISEMSNDSRRSSLIRGNTFELKPGDEKLSHLRQEQERRQGTLVFNNSIPQYSGHRVDGDSISDGSNNFSSISYFPIEATSLSTDRFKYKKSRNTGGFLSFDGSNSLTKIDDANGIYSMTKSASDKLLADYSETDDSSIGDCMSLPMTFNDNLQRGGRICTIKKTKHDETTPILSGGVCTTDYSKPIDSPIVRRKTETTPIVSGGSVIMELPQEKIKTPPKMSSSMTAAWVVDMSDCTKLTNQKSNPASPNMSKSFSTYDAKNRTKTPDKPNSLGFFINFNDIDNPRASKTTSVQSLKKDGNKKQSFFVDISGETRVKKNQETVNSAGKLQDKKNIFSMFIDLNDSQCVKSGNREIKSMSCLQQGQRGGIDDSGNSSSNGKSDSSGELRSSDKKGVFMFIESDSPVVRRRTLSTSRPAFKRHSWNMEKCQQQISPNPNSNTSNGNIQKEITSFRREHKRAHSVSIDPVMQLKLSAKKSESSASLNQIGKSCSLNIPETAQETSSSHPEALNFDQFDYEIRDTPPNSHVELVNDDLRGRVKEQEYKELVRSDMFSSTETKTLDDDRSDVSMWEKTATESIDGHTRKSETFDISSGTASGPSPESDNNDFDLAEYHNELLHVDNQQQKNPPKLSETHKSLTETIKKIECEFEDGFKNDDTKLDTTKSDTKENEESKASCSGFVRLSDLDKTPATKIVTEEINDNTRITNISYRMSKSIPETSWVESKLAINRVSGPCQVRTLSSRKFSTIMSTSLPAKNKSPTDELLASGFGGSEMPSESDLSSMQSSMGRSGVDVSTEETETSSFIATKPYNRLGEDLLRMFLEEINPDVTIDVGGRRIRAHKCILSSRCQYFAAILSGGWIESAGNVISLQGYSYSSVHFALCHIYSGDSNIPDSISIVELATLADMLCLEGLKEVIGYTLKVKYCHLFHKPCQICTVGVLECMPLAAAYGLDEVYRKSLRWITRHFVRIWPCKAFSALPRELMDKCYQQHIVHMSADNVLQTIMDCDKLLATLPNVRWAEPVFRMVSNLLEIGLKFLSDNFSNVLSNDSFHALGRDLTWNISRLEDNVLSAADKLPPDQACKSYSKLYKMLATIPPEDSIIKPQWSLLFIEFLKKIQGRVEKCLIKDAARAARTTTWLKMDLELRRRIQELACLVILPHEQLKRPTRHSNFMKDLKTPPSRTSASRSLDLRRVKRTITDQVEKTFVKSGIPQANKNLMSTKPKTDPLERKMQGVKVGMTSEVNYIRPKSWPNKLEVKSRYLEPRNKSIPKDNVPERTITAQQRRKNLISSSDSSRTSSPAMKRAADKKPISKLKLSVKKDVKALSTDSLTDASTSLKSRKKETSKSCGITRAESRAESPSLKTKDIGISADSLAETKKKPAVTKKPSKMDNSMSTDSLTTELTVTPKTNIGNKKSPTLGRSTIKSQALERAKKSSPPMNQRSPLSITKRPVRSVENSTAASRNRAAATTTIYHGSPNLRRNLLDAAKTPDLPQSKITNGTSSSSRINSRQSTPSTSTPPAIKKDKKDINNPVRSDSPNKRSPKLNNGINRPSRPTNVAKKTYKGIEDKFKTKCNDSLKQPTVGSRSGTFLKDEPTILKKSDMKKNQVTT